MLRDLEAHGGGGDMPTAETGDEDHMNHQVVYRLVGHGCEVEVFDERVVVLQVGRGVRLSDEVAKLAELRQRGVLSDEEFVAAKRRVIGA